MTSADTNTFAALGKAWCTFTTANATFSCWGVWLGEADDKLVFTPELTNDGVGKYAGWNVEGLLPDQWTKIPLIEDK